MQALKSIILIVEQQKTCKNSIFYFPLLYDHSNSVFLSENKRWKKYVNEEKHTKILIKQIFRLDSVGFSLFALQS